MSLVIDVYNVLHAALGAAGKGRELSVWQLGRLLGQSRYVNRRAWLVCDGVRSDDVWGPRPAPLVEIIFAGPGRDADSLIEELLRRSTAPRDLTVISTDRRVVRAARRAGSATISSECFTRQVILDASQAAMGAAIPSPRDQVPLSPRAVGEWLDHFDMKSDPMLSVPAAARVSIPEPVPAPERGRKPKQRTTPAPPAAAAPTDPLLLEAVRAFQGRVHLEELDMSRWLGSGADRFASSDGRS